MKKRSIYLELLVVFIVFVLIAIFVKGQPENESMKLILSVSTFTFAIFLGFSVANRHQRLNGIRHGLRSCDGEMVIIYYASKMFGKKISDECKKKIDDHITETIDYKLEDFDTSMSTLITLYEFILNLEYTNAKQKNAKEEMLSAIRNLISAHKETTYHVKDKMVAFEWGSILLLLGAMLFSLYYMNPNTLISVIILPIVSVALVLIILVLRDINSLRWQEKHWIWDPLEDLFNEIDLLPYYPKDLFDANRLKDKQIAHLEKYRIATYPNPYPDMRGKKITVVNRK